MYLSNKMLVERIKYRSIIVYQLWNSLYWTSPFFSSQGHLLVQTTIVLSASFWAVSVHLCCLTVSNVYLIPTRKQTLVPHCIQFHMSALVHWDYLWLIFSSSFPLNLLSLNTLNKVTTGFCHYFQSIMAIPIPLLILEV